MKRVVCHGLLLAVAALALAGCEDGPPRPATKDGVLQTRMAGQITAGGPSSGEVIAAAAPAMPHEGGPAGTPGTPGGAGGNIGGAQLGATMPHSTQAAAATNAPAVPASGPPSAPVSAAAGTPATTGGAPALGAPPPPPLPDAERQKIALAAAQDATVARWRSNATSHNWPTHPAAALDTAANAPGAVVAPAAPAAPASAAASVPGPAIAAEAPIRSEKLGTAPPSEDVKQPTRPKTDPGVGADAPKSASPRP